MNSKLRPTPIPIPEELSRFPTAPPILPAAIERLATSVADNYFTQPNGKTRDDVTVRRNRGPTLHAPWRIQPAILPDPRIRIGSAQPRYDRVGDSLIMRQ